MAITFSNISIDEPTTVDKLAATVQIDRDGVGGEEREIVVLGDPESSIAIARVTGAAPDSTHFGAVVRQVGYVAPSTTAQVSSVGGAVIVRSSAANHLVTAYQSTAADLQATVTPASTTWAVQLSNYSTTAQVSSVGGIVAITPVSTASVRVAQSSYTELHGLMRLADRDQSTQVVAVTNTDPDSTAWALAVRQVPGSGSTQVAVSSVAGRVAVGEYSSAAPAANSTGLIVRIASPSTGAFSISSIAGVSIVRQESTTWAVQLNNYSTTVNISSLAGPVIVRSSAADHIVTVKNSTIGELLASVQQNSTVWFVQGGLTTRPATNASALAVRPVLNDLQSTCFSTIGNNSTSSTIVSSAAGVRHKVYAYSITSTAQAVNTLSFASSLGNPIWQVQMQSVSSGITGANLAVTPPAWLFATESASPLVFKITGSTGSYHLSFSYFTEA